MGAGRPTAAAAAAAAAAVAATAGGAASTAAAAVAAVAATAEAAAAAAAADPAAHGPPGSGRLNQLRSSCSLGDGSHASLRLPGEGGGELERPCTPRERSGDDAILIKDDLQS
jgi:hypothetical protein